MILEKVVLVVPKGGDPGDARKFLESRRAWVFVRLQGAGNGNAELRYWASSEEVERVPG